MNISEQVIIYEKENFDKICFVHTRTNLFIKKNADSPRMVGLSRALP